MFSPTVVLGACHGYGSSGAPPDAAHEGPIRLLTVISARGTTWTVGGHQQINDATSAWILSRTYEALAAGAALHDALQSAQLAFLEHAEAVETGLPQRLNGLLAATADNPDLSAPWQLGTHNCRTSSLGMTDTAPPLPSTSRAGVRFQRRSTTGLNDYQDPHPRRRRTTDLHTHAKFMVSLVRVVMGSMSR